MNSDLTANSARLGVDGAHLTHRCPLGCLTALVQGALVRAMRGDLSRRNHQQKPQKLENVPFRKTMERTLLPGEHGLSPQPADPQCSLPATSPVTMNTPRVLTLGPRRNFGGRWVHKDEAGAPALPGDPSTPCPRCPQALRGRRCSGVVRLSASWEAERRGTGVLSRTRPLQEGLEAEAQCGGRGGAGVLGRKSLGLLGIPASLGMPPSSHQAHWLLRCGRNNPARAFEAEALQPWGSGQAELGPGARPKQPRGGVLTVAGPLSDGQHLLS